MTKAAFRQADIERILRAAAKTGATVQIDIRSLVITIMPGSGVAPAATPAAPRYGSENWEDDSGKAKPEDFETLAEWSAWRERERAKEKNKSRFDYNWADVPPDPISPRFNPRENATMKHLVKLGKDVRIHWRTLKNFGADTQKRLEDRGYLGVSYESDPPGRLDEVWLTQAGAKAWQAMEEHRRKWPSL